MNPFRKNDRPQLSIIVIVYDMAREAPRTLRSLAVGYQAEMTEKDYEVIVVDNGSPTPLGEQLVKDFGPQYRYVYIEDAHPSPAQAVNIGVSKARGEFVGIMIDGARIATPGILRHARLATRLFDDPIVATLGWHLGPEAQQISTTKGYDKAAEDRLLANINWPYAGYRLFEVGSLGGSSRRGCFAPPYESNCVFLRKSSFDSMGGFDERFDFPGGGMVNLDFFSRACDREGARLVILPGEGTFHQLHGGVSTNISKDENDAENRKYLEQYISITGKPLGPIDSDVFVLGKLPREAFPSIRTAADFEAIENDVVAGYRALDLL